MVGYNHRSCPTYVRSPFRPTDGRIRTRMARTCLVHSHLRIPSVQKVLGRSRHKQALVQPVPQVLHQHRGCNMEWLRSLGPWRIECK
jgi:hypothetical protein